MDLAFGAVLERSGATAARPSRKAELLAMAQRFMLDENQHVGRGLSPTDVARAIAVSERYLFDLFRETGCSPTAWLWEARLERAHRMLGDPRHRHRTIGEIASLTGFASGAHFSRAFRGAVLPLPGSGGTQLDDPMVVGQADGGAPGWLRLSPSLRGPASPRWASGTGRANLAGGTAERSVPGCLRGIRGGS